jgi:hypothetical protein
MNIYKSIEFLPIYNFYKIMDTNDLRYLLVLDNYFELPEYNEDLTNIWEEIRNQLMTSQEIDDVLKRILSLMIEIEELKIDLEIFSDRSAQTWIELKEMKLESLMKDFNKNETSDFYDKVANIENHFKRNIDIFKTPVKLFFAYIKQYNQEMQALKQNKNYNRAANY